MTVRSSFLYAKKIFLSRGKNSRHSLKGAVICIALSLVPLVAILSLSEGMISGITGRIINLSTQDISIQVPKKSPCTRSAESFYEAKKRIEKIDGVKEVYPEFQMASLAAGSSFRTGAILRGVDRNVFSSNKSYRDFFKIHEGSVDFKSEDGIVVGTRIAEILSLHCGDSISIITASTLGKKIIPKIMKFTVEGIVSSGYQELDALWIFLPIEKAFSSFPKKAADFTFGIKTEDSFSKELLKIQNRIQEELFNDEELNESYVLRWDQINATQFENFSSTKALLLVIMILIVLVASINISSAIVMIVMERKKEIAILKSMGASSFGVMTSFLIAAFFAGASGVLLGIPAGLLISYNVNEIIWAVEKTAGIFSDSSFKLLSPDFYLQTIPIVIPYKEIGIIAAGTVVLSVLVSLLPSVRAGMSKPLDTLRKV